MKTFFERLEELRAEQRKNLHIGPQPLYLSALEDHEWRGPKPEDKPDTSDRGIAEIDDFVIDFTIS